LSTSITQAQNDAVTMAAANNCDGSAVVIDPNLDIEFGAWDPGTRTFTLLSGGAQNSANAVRISARRIAARNTAIPLVFARLIGRSTCDINAMAIAFIGSGPLPQIIGLGSVTVHRDCYFVSYNSTVTPTPTLASANSNVLVGTNGVIQFENNNHIYGTLELGPSGSISGTAQVTGATTTMSSPIPTPSSPAWNPGTNPAGISQNCMVSADTTLPGGTYWFTSLIIKKNLFFSGPATLYINGDVDMPADKADIAAYNNVPANLKIYQIGLSRTFGDVNRNELGIIADIEAPGSTLAAHDKLEFRGSAIFSSIVIHDGAYFYADETSGVGQGGRRIQLVK